MTAQWGPHAWKFIHYVTITYPEYPTYDDRYNFYEFIDSLDYILPCSQCRQHYQDYRMENNLSSSDSPVLDSKGTLIKWFFDFHNSVNEKLGKGAYPWSSFLSEYVGDHSKQGYCQNYKSESLGIRKNSIPFFMITLIILCIVLCLCFCIKKR